jgi:triacylglycerol esterase/lipase EstA (alpha/beta hydrolase family)
MKTDSKLLPQYDPPPARVSLVMHLGVMLLIEIGVELAVLYLLIQRGMPPWQAPLALAGLMVAFRLVMVSQLFVIAHFARMRRAPEQQIGPVATLRLLAAETAAFFKLYCGLHLFEPFLKLRNPAQIVPGQRPIICVHGFMCNGGYFYPLIRALRARGHENFYTINCQPPFGDISHFAGQLARRVDEALQETCADRAILIGHSMGGLTSRAYANSDAGAGKIAKIITLGTPHHGTAHARFSGAKDARQMRPGNAWLAALNARETGATPQTSLYSFHDDVIAPQDSSHIPWGNNISFKGIGHLEMSFSKPIQDAVHDEIAACARA